MESPCRPATDFLLSPLVPSLTMKPLCLNHLSCFTTSLIYCYGIHSLTVCGLGSQHCIICSWFCHLEWGSAGWLSAGLTWGHGCRCYHLESQTELEHPEWHHLHARTSAGIAGTVGSWLGISFSVSLQVSPSRIDEFHGIVTHGPPKSTKAEASRPL